MTITTTRRAPARPNGSVGNWVAVNERDYPWNTIGTVLSGGGMDHNDFLDGKTIGHLTDHLMTAAEALAATGLDQIVIQKVPVKDATTGKVIPRAFHTAADYPDGERVYYAAVSDKFEVVQPAEAMTVFDAIVEQVDGAHYSAVWDMREKSMMGVTIEMPDTILVDPKGAADEVHLHILGVNAFDASMSLSGTLQATRYFCTNQLVPMIFGGRGRARKGMDRAFRFRHTSGVKNRIPEAQAALGVMLDYARELDAVANNLYALPMSDGQFDKFLARLTPFSLDGGETDLVKNRVLERRVNARQVWESDHNATIRGTRWGALNVVAEYAEWGRNVRGSSRNGTDPVRQRAIGTLVHPSVTGLVNEAMDILV